MYDPFKWPGSILLSESHKAFDRYSPKIPTVGRLY